MIREKTYLGVTDMGTALLSAFSAIDESLAGELDEAAAERELRRLMVRLATLAALHDDNAPSRMLDGLRTPDVPHVEFVSQLLERGAPDRHVPAADFRELQQELVHFSRITDLMPQRDGAMRRLARSHRIPLSLKVLAELITVVRSRLVATTGNVPTPLRPVAPSQLCKTEDDRSVLVRAITDTHFIFGCWGGRRRQRLQAAYLFEQLVQYLTPLEATLAVSAYASESDAWDTLGLFAAERHAGSVRCVQRAEPSTTQQDFWHWLGARIPRLATLPTDGPTSQIDLAGSHVTVDGPSLAVTFPCGTSCRTALLPTAPIIYADSFFCQAAVDAYRSADDPSVVASLECGHVHLDRNVDRDQRIGTAIGRALIAQIQPFQKEPVALVPMVDDDHVLVRLAPSAYRRQFAEWSGTDVFHLTPESSPIIRAIVVWLFTRLRLEACAAIVKRGGNLYLEHRQVHCELFEDIAGRCDNGCVLFEVGLLTYRSAIGLFHSAFHDRFALDTSIHAAILAQLDRTDAPFDAVANDVQRMCRLFESLTNPLEPDADWCALCERAMAELSAAPRRHINVLEDYYESQQEKVRRLIELLRLPFSLATVFFNSSTGRVTLAS